jgi:hypothetical protein
MIAVIEPGGWLQWEEYDHDESGKPATLKSNHEIPSPKCDKALEVQAKMFSK